MDLKIPSLQPTILRIEIIFPAISIFIVALRLFSRYLSKRIGWDDILVAIALILAIAAGAASYLYTITNWRGYHLYDIPMQTFSYQSMAGKFNLTIQVLYNPILVLVRASIIVFILSLYHLSKATKYNLYAINTVNAAFFFCVLFPTIFQCHPFHYTYDKSQMDRAARIAAGAGPDGRVDGKLVYGGSCIERPAFYISTSIISICLDFWLLAIPSAMVWGINMPRRQKVAVIVILSFWIVATIFGILRLVTVAPWWDHYVIYDVENSRYTTASSFHWIEVNLSIWSAAVPALKPLITRYFPRWWRITRFEQGYINHRVDVAVEAGLPRVTSPPSYQPGSRQEILRPSLPGSTLRPGAMPRPAPSYLLPENLHRGITPSQIELSQFEHGMGTKLDSAYYRSTSSQESSRSCLDESGSGSPERPAASSSDSETPVDRGSPRAVE